MKLKRVYFAAFAAIFTMAFAACENQLLMNILPDTYTVTFDKNHGDPGGSGPNPSAIAVTPQGRTVGSLPSDPIRPGYSFEGWNTGRDGSGRLFTANTLVERDMTVYAQWVVNAFKVTFDKNNDDPDSTEADPSEITVMLTVENLPDEPEWENHTFTGWNTKADGTGSIFTANTLVNSDITVYAQWDSYTVIFDSNNDGDPEGTEADPDIVFVRLPMRTVGTMMPEPPTRPDYHFLGWNTEPDGSGELFSASTLVTESVTVYAQWERYRYHVVFDRNNDDELGTEPEPGKITVVRPNWRLNDEAGKVPGKGLPEKPWRPNWTFAGWNSEADGSGYHYTETTIIEDDITLYAQWHPYAYTVKGKVTLSDGEAASAIGADGFVQLWQDGSLLETTVILSGSYTFTGIQYGDYVIRAEPGTSGYNSGYLPLENAGVFVGGDVDDFDLELAPVMVDRGGERSEPFTYLKDALAFIKEEGAGGYTVSVGKGQTLTSELGDMTDASGTGIVFITPVNQVTVGLSGTGSLFTVGQGVTLTVNSGFTLEGVSGNDSALVKVIGSFTMNGGVKITGNENTETDGGGVYVEPLGVFTMNGGEISGNDAVNGGGVYTEGTFVFEGGSILNNAGTLGEKGGGVYIGGSTTLTMNGGTVSGNKASIGGGVYAEDGFTLNGGEIKNNTAAANGGGVYTEGGFTLSGGEIRNNTAVSGGGVYAVSSFSMTGGVISGNTTGYQSVGGGGVYAASAFNMEGGEISGNSGWIGGGVYVNTGGTFNMSGGAVSGNSASGGGHQGGGVYVLQGSAMMTGGTISNSGGNGVYIQSGDSHAEFTMTGGTISDNGGYGGGGVYVNANGGNAEFTMAGGTISGNTTTTGGTSGGGVYVSAYSGGNAEFTMTGGAISRNSISSYGSGGGVSVSAGSDSHAEFTMTGGTVSGNSNSLPLGYPNAGGGGVSVSANAEFTLSGGTISGNTTSNNGGGVYVGTDGTFTMTGGNIFKNNTASGGGVYVETGGTFTMNGGDISGNMATSGGGVYSNGTAFDFTGGAISQNNATNGGGVYKNSGTFAMTGGEISNNTSSIGGGVYISSGGFALEDGAISSNLSRLSGGGVHIAQGAELIMQSGTPVITKNLSVDGGGVCIYDGGIFTLKSGDISENDGGGVMIKKNNSVFTMKGGAIRKNFGTGVRIQAEAGTYGEEPSNILFTLEAGEISENSNGGVDMIAIEGSRFIMSGGKISGNTRQYGGAGGISAYTRGYTGFIVTMSGGEISGNTGPSGGVYIGAGWQNPVRFYKTGGGIIYGIEDDANANIATSGSGGHAVACDTGDNIIKIRNTTADETVNLDSTIVGAGGGWEN